MLEPYLIANGYIERTARGRIATPKTYEHFKLGGMKDGLFE
jgi:Holliday junction DNA helicase RuvB